MRHSPRLLRTRESSPLTPKQKRAVLRQMRSKLQDQREHSEIIERLFTDVKKNNHFGYPALIADLIQDLYAPYQYLNSSLAKKYEKIILAYLNENAIRLFEESCEEVEGWGHTQIYQLSTEFDLKFDPDMVVEFTLDRGKFIWRILYDEKIVFCRYPLAQNKKILRMTFDDFTELKIAGKRNPSNTEPFALRIGGRTQHHGFFRRDRSPRARGNRDHGDTDICHVCTWDVGTYHDLNLHKKGNHKNETKAIKENRPCCGPDLPLQFDHIPAASLLEVMKWNSEKGYAIAVPKKLHEYVSATYQNKAKTKNLFEEANNPALALDVDISAYFDYFQKHSLMSIVILGAFRYLYRKNVKLSDGFSSVRLDELFLNAIDDFLQSEEAGKPRQLFKEEGESASVSSTSSEEDSDQKPSARIRNFRRDSRDFWNERREKPSDKGESEGRSFEEGESEEDSSESRGARRKNK